MRLPGDQTLALGAKCLHVLIAELTEEGVPPADLQPLVDLEAFLQMLKAQAQGRVAPIAASGVRRAELSSPARAR